jgi:hypothetical protein
VLVLLTYDGAASTRAIIYVEEKWIILAAVAVGFGLMGWALLLVLLFGFFAGQGEATVFPVYTTEQSASFVRENKAFA